MSSSQTPSKADQRSAVPESVLKEILTDIESLPKPRVQISITDLIKKSPNSYTRTPDLQSRVGKKLSDLKLQGIARFVKKLDKFAIPLGPHTEQELRIQKERDSQEALQRSERELSLLSLLTKPTGKASKKKDKNNDDSDDSDDSDDDDQEYEDEDDDQEYEDGQEYEDDSSNIGSYYSATPSKVASVQRSVSDLPSVIEGLQINSPPLPRHSVISPVPARVSGQMYSPSPSRAGHRSMDGSTNGDELLLENIDSLRRIVQAGTQEFPRIQHVDGAYPERNYPVEITYVSGIQVGNTVYNKYFCRMLTTLHAIHDDTSLPIQVFLPNKRFPSLDGRVMMVREMSLNGWFFPTDDYHSSFTVPCGTTATALGMTEQATTATHASEDRKWRYFLYVFPEGTMLENHIFSNHSTIVEVSPTEHYADFEVEQTTEAGKSEQVSVQLAGASVYWDIALSGGEAVAEKTPVRKKVQSNRTKRNKSKNK